MQNLGTFAYAFSSNEDEQQLASSYTPVPLFPFVFFDARKSLQEMFSAYFAQLRTARAHPLADYHPSDVVFATISSYLIKQRCPHFLSAVELYCSKCYKYYPCKYCHEDSECFDFKCDRIRCALCENEYALESYQDKCPGCKKQLSNYCCLKCSIFLSNAEEYKLFHCPDCYQCIRGTRDEFVTCKICKYCIPRLMLSLHYCKIDEDICCVCHGQFDQLIRKKVTFRCQHYMHYACWKQIGEKCPLCAKELHEITQRTVFNSAYLNYLLQISVGDVDTQTLCYYCKQCGAMFSSTVPACCYYPFCRSCDCEQISCKNDIVSACDTEKILRDAGCYVPIVYRNDEQIKALLPVRFGSQPFWYSFGGFTTAVLLDFCNLFDCKRTWQAVCLLLNKGYAETSPYAGEGLAEEMRECVQQIAEFAG